MLQLVQAKREREFDRELSLIFSFIKPGLSKLKISGERGYCSNLRNVDVQVMRAVQFSVFHVFFCDYRQMYGTRTTRPHASFAPIFTFTFKKKFTESPYKQLRILFSKPCKRRLLNVVKSMTF